MDCQTIINKFRINKDKRTGNVLYIVEGARKEFNLIINLFQDILGFEYVAGISREGKEYGELTKPGQINSKIYIINTENSNVKSITDINGFIEKQIEEINKYDFDFRYEYIPIYYIFDCDRHQDEDDIHDLVKDLNNSREGTEFNKIGGMLLLGYPSIESYVISHFENDIFDFYNRNNASTKLKQYTGDNQYDFARMNITTLKSAFEEMIKSIMYLGVNDIDVDNFKDANVKIFEKEQEKNNKVLLSLLLVSLMDLGIIEIEQ